MWRMPVIGFEMENDIVGSLKRTSLQVWKTRAMEQMQDGFIKWNSDEG